MTRWVGVGAQQPRAGFERTTSRSQVRHRTTRPPRTYLNCINLKNKSFSRHDVQWRSYYGGVNCSCKHSVITVIINDDNTVGCYHRELGKVFYRACDRLWRHPPGGHLSWRHNVTYRRNEAEISPSRRRCWSTISVLPARWTTTNRRPSPGRRLPTPWNRPRGRRAAGRSPKPREWQPGGHSAETTEEALQLPRSQTAAFDDGRQ